MLMGMLSSCSLPHSCFVSYGLSRRFCKTLPLPLTCYILVHKKKICIWLYFIKEEEERKRKSGRPLSQFVAYIPNKESWKPVRDQSYSPKGLTARCPHNTFKASNSPPDQMQPGSVEKQWSLRLEPVSARTASLFVAGGIFFFLRNKRKKRNLVTQDATISSLRAIGE